MVSVRIFQLFDSALPIGSFNFSNGVEEAYYSGLDVKEFIRSTFKSVVLMGDVAAARIAFEDPRKADSLVFASKLTAELRDATRSMGVSLVRLGLCQNDYLNGVLEDKEIGTYPVTVAQTCKCMDIDVDTCLKGLAYSELAQMVFSAVRLGSMDYINGQKLIYSLMEEFKIADEFSPFSPVLDYMSRKHQIREPKVFSS
ncbi:MULTISPECIES: urease accessory protein UreF [Acidianus]|uniref:Urease accessory protein UreF n=1 Tax=Candidatus Acidianus copahuensis TaxID=1160895 RepID=A0A031LXP5_9CREN|nr:MULTISPECIES: urease accessory UreF family protein [Acidianus]EZQ12274.1 urease accessory protein UreF [Candidatus Acidianus copahuensis]NON61592.1 urease accessory protein UreF [Acidianus sp. RZ1]